MIVLFDLVAKLIKLHPLVATDQGVLIYTNAGELALVTIESVSDPE